MTTRHRSSTLACARPPRPDAVAASPWHWAGLLLTTRGFMRT